MALHKKETVRDELMDDVYACTDVCASIPKYRFPKVETPASTPTNWCMTS